MPDVDIDEFVKRAEAIYFSSLRNMLEPEHVDEFVAIEPDSGDYFLAPTMSEAVAAARSFYPDRLVHAMRVGHRAALHFGMHIQ